MRDNENLIPVKSARWREKNRPPRSEDNPDLQWGWITIEMLMSDAFRALTGPAFMVLMRIWVEHISHAGGENGELKCTYDDLVEYGVRRSSIRPAIDLLTRVGWIDIEVPGRAGKGIGRYPTRYRLTWLPMRDGAPATNRWKAYRAPAPSRSIYSSNGNETVETSAKSRTRPDLSLENETGNSPENETREKGLAA